MTNLVHRVLTAGLLASFCGVGIASVGLADNYNNDYTQQQLHQMVQEGVISPQQGAVINQRLANGWQGTNNSGHCHHSNQQNQARNFHQMLQAQQMGFNANGNYANGGYANGNYANAYGMPTYAAANNYYGDNSNGLYNTNGLYSTNGLYNGNSPYGNVPYGNLLSNGYGSSPYNSNGSGFTGISSVMGSVLNNNGGQYSTPYSGNGGAGLTSAFQNFLQNR